MVLSPGGGNGYPLQYFSLGNPMDSGVWWATVHGLQRVRQDWACKHQSKIFLDSCLSVTKLCLTLCNPMDCSTPGFPVLHLFPEFAQTHIHWAGNAIQPSQVWNLRMETVIIKAFKKVYLEKALMVIKQENSIPQVQCHKIFKFINIIII